MNNATKQRPTGFKPSEISALINEEVVQQHAEEAAFQWLLRDAAVFAPNYNLARLADLDERVEANVDGLRVAGNYGWKLCEEQLVYNEPGEIFAAGVLAFESGDEERIQKVLEVVETEKELSRALISSLGWISYQLIERRLDRLLTSDVDMHRRVGIGGYAVHRKDPGPGLINVVHDGEPMARARAFKAVGELGRVDLVPILLGQVSDRDEACHFYAAWSTARLGSRAENVIAMLGDYIVLASDYAEKALSMVLRCLQLDQARKLYQKLKTSPDHLRLACIGAGIIGDPILIPDLIELMTHKYVARVAGEAFSMITGIDIEYNDLDQKAPDVIEAGPTENPEDEDVALDPDEDLPWPEPDLVRKWWADHRTSFVTGKRYLAGQPVSPKNCRTILATGFQRQRMAAALEIALMEPRRPLFETRDRGYRQQRLLGINKWALFHDDTGK